MPNKNSPLLLAHWIIYKLLQKSQSHTCDASSCIDWVEEVTVQIYDVPVYHLNATRAIIPQCPKIKPRETAYGVPAWASHRVFGEPGPCSPHVVAQGELLCCKIGRIRAENLCDLREMIRCEIG